MYCWNTKILYSALGVNGTLSVAGLLNLFQDTAILHSEDRGRGRDWVASQGCAWILSRWRVRLGDMPRCGQPVRLETRAYHYRRALCRRSFSLEDGEGRTLALADTLWTLIDISTGAPTDAGGVVAPLLTDEPAPDLGDLPKKVRLPENLSPGEPFPVTRDLLDANHHVNNVRSVELAMRGLPPEASLSALAVDYHLPLLPGQIVSPAFGPAGDSLAASLSAEGQLCVSAQFWLK